MGIINLILKYIALVPVGISIAFYVIAATLVWITGAIYFKWCSLLDNKKYEMKNYFEFIKEKIKDL